MRCAIAFAARSPPGDSLPNEHSRVLEVCLVDTNHRKRLRLLCNRARQPADRKEPSSEIRTRLIIDREMCTLWPCMGTPGETLRILRRGALRLSQRGLGRRIGRCQSVVSYMEAGRLDIGEDVLRELRRICPNREFLNLREAVVAKRSSRERANA
jgi:hypothetical protein